MVRNIEVTVKLRRECLKYEKLQICNIFLSVGTSMLVSCSVHQIKTFALLRQDDPVITADVPKLETNKSRSFALEELHKFLFVFSITVLVFMRPFS